MFVLDSLVRQCNEPLWKLTTVLPGNGSDVVVRIAKCFPLPDNTESVLIRHLFKQLVEKLEEILDFPLIFHSPACVCVFAASCETQGSSIGSVSSMSNTRYCAQWGIHWEQWCWQWKAIMDLSDKFANCPSSSLTAHISVEVVLYELLCEEESEWRTGFPEWCFLCCFEEGRVDSLYLSLINLSDEVEKCLYLINKRDTAYAFPQNFLSGFSEEMWAGSEMLMEDVLWRWESPRLVGIPYRKCVIFQDFPKSDWKGVFTVYVPTTWTLVSTPELSS